MTATIRLRDYQRDAHHAVIGQYVKGTRRTLIVLPTGAGKTIVFGSVIARASAKGCRSLVVAHTEELVDQAARTLRALLPNVSVGIVRAHHDEADAQVVVATVQTLRTPRRLDRVGQFELIVVDEAHHAVARTYQDILEQLGAFDDANVFPFVLGVTATADRADGQGLGHVFESICYETGIFDLIQRGYLSDVRAKRILLDVNLDRVQTRGGDFVDSALGEAMTDAGAPGHIAAAIRDHAPGRRTIVFTPTVAMAEQTAAAVNAIGIPARAVSGETPQAERQQIIDDVRSGALRVICNCMVLVEGFDAPILDCAVMARPTSSRSLYQQSAGRVLRPSIGKADALILDMVGVTTRHSVQSAASLIDDLPAGSVIEEGETASEAVARIAAEGAMPEISGATLIAIDVDVFHRSDLNWVAGSNSSFMLTGASNAFVIRPRAGEDSCDVFRLEQSGWDYRAIRVAEDVDLAMAQALAEDGARRTGLDAMTMRAQAWRQDPVTDGQLRKLWAIGVRSRNVRNAITTKGQASDLIATVMAERAIEAHDDRGVTERMGVAA